MEWPLTFKCNNNCISCIIDTRMTCWLGQQSKAKLFEIIDKIPETEIFGVTGGEPTLREDFVDILAYARKKHPNKFIFVVSNGRKFSGKDFVDKISKHKLEPIRFGIALYSHKPEVHDSITQFKGSWNETVNGIKKLLEKGFKVELRILVEKINYKHLKKTAEFIVKNFKGLERVVFINLKYTGNAFINRRKVFVRYSKAAPFVEKAAETLLRANFEVMLFHFPLCIMDKKYWHLAEGITKQETELTLIEACEICKVKEKCPKIWKSYIPLAGEEEFNPII
ncbi:MAG: radical SAM protein [Candidatus Diapherotrites archaeon]|nr:radical SAM protein [Candidatus Diapherotrites archaeon]